MIKEGMKAIKSRGFVWFKGFDGVDNFLFRYGFEEMRVITIL